jgi:hypothetical protein
MTNVGQRTADLSHDIYPVSEIASFNFLSGKVDVVFGRREEAKEHLEKALLCLPLEKTADRRLVLSLLVPVNLTFGVLPSTTILEKYGLDLYRPLVEATIEGNLSSFDDDVAQNRLRYIRMGIWEMLVLSRRLVERRALETIYECWGDTKLPISVVAAAMGIEESRAEMLVCNLIYAGLMKAYVAHNHGMIVFGRDGFPALPVS